MRGFMANEGETGVRLLTAPNGPFRPRFVARVAAIIADEASAGRYNPPTEPAVLADGIVALGERYLHNGADPTLNPDPATAHTMVSLLLRERC
jgi:hypothetical protein